MLARAVNGSIWRWDSVSGFVGQERDIKGGPVRSCRPLGCRVEERMESLWSYCYCCWENLSYLESVRACSIFGLCSYRSGLGIDRARRVPPPAIESTRVGRPRLGRDHENTPKREGRGGLGVPGSSNWSQLRRNEVAFESFFFLAGWCMYDALLRERVWVVLLVWRQAVGAALLPSF